MGDGGAQYQEGVLSDIRFLADSPNRSQVLKRLLTGSATRGDLQHTTGASRVTISRILAGCTDRGWVAERDRSYHLTALGERVIRAYDALYQTIDTVQTVSRFWEWLPLDHIDFDPAVLDDAEVTYPHPTDPFNTVRAFAREVGTATAVHLVTPSLYGEGLRETADALDADRQRFEAVVAADALDRIEADDSLRAALEDILDVPTTRLYSFDGDLPNYVVAVIDGIATLHVFDEHGHPRVLLRSAHPAVRDWSWRQFETYAADATPYPPE